MVISRVTETGMESPLVSVRSNMFILSNILHIKTPREKQQQAEARNQNSQGQMFFYNEVTSLLGSQDRAQ